jgi:hypothetical protein
MDMRELLGRAATTPALNVIPQSKLVQGPRDPTANSMIFFFVKTPLLRAAAATRANEFRPNVRDVGPMPPVSIFFIYDLGGRRT